MATDVKSQILNKVATLLDKFSDRLVRVARETRQNTDAVAALQDKVRLDVGALQEQLSVLGEVAAISRARTDALAALQDQTRLKTGQTAEQVSLLISSLDKREARFQDEVVRLKTQNLTLLDRIKEVAFENDKREEAQTLRDQSNVQSMHDLKNSVQKAFDLVRGDVKTLLERVQSLNERVGKVESQTTILAGCVGDLNIAKQQASALPSDHVWVNKKFTSAYNVMEEIEKRVASLEETNVVAARYLGYTVKARGNQIVVEDSVGVFTSFPLPDRIANFVTESYGIIVTVKNGDKYLLVGGPNPNSMYILLYKKA